MNDAVRKLLADVVMRDDAYNFRCAVEEYGSGDCMLTAINSYHWEQLNYYEKKYGIDALISALNTATQLRAKPQEANNGNG